MSELETGLLEILARAYVMVDGRRSPILAGYLHDAMTWAVQMRRLEADQDRQDKVFETMMRTPESELHDYLQGG